MNISTTPEPSARINGRGATYNPPSRFEPLHYEPDEGIMNIGATRTQALKDSSRTIITSNNSPDIGFDHSINPYRGCEHGCIYCYARPTHEYLGFSSGLDFESKILVKEDAAQLLHDKLLSSNWNPQVLALSGVTDPYQPMERKLKVTRRVLEVLAEFRNPVVIVTKNHLVTRDIDLLQSLARVKAVVVNISMTTLDTRIQRCMEPRTSSPYRRLAAIEALARAGIPVRVLVAPVIPALTDYEIPSIIQAVSRVGASSASYMFLRLPHAVKELFQEWLELYFPEQKKRVMSRIRSLRGGQLNDHRFHFRMRGEGEYADQIKALFESSCRRFGLSDRDHVLSADAFCRPEKHQMSLFD